MSESAKIQTHDLPLPASEPSGEQEQDLGAVSATAVDTGPCSVPADQLPHDGGLPSFSEQFRMGFEYAAAQWQPISTLNIPVQHSFLGYCAENRCSYTLYRSEGRFYHFAGSGFAYVCVHEVTHWMPLPSPPVPDPSPSKVEG